MILSANIPKLTLITDSQRLSQERFFEVVSEALAGGVDTVLVREKQMDSARLLAFASTLRELTGIHQAKLIIHTQADIAKAVSADGVHVSSLEMNQIPGIRNWLDREAMTVSASCHNETELGFAQRFGADFAFLAPVFPTQSHPGQPHLGIKQFREMAAGAFLPVIALGGINRGNRKQLKGFPVAVIGAILNADDPKAAAEGLI
ncbi:MAG: thiamine phosphate synthase [Mariprofundaceae bacterium]|nr:thiamine phosphate synthase [Mariprofundaceae bacterium]